MPAPKKNVRTDSPDMRSRILEVSAELFANKGFEGVSIRTISNEVGVKLPTLYYYFRDKLDLYKEVEAMAYGKAATMLQKSFESTDLGPDQQLRLFVITMLNIFEKDKTFYKLVQRNLLESDAENRKFLVENGLQKLFDGLKNLIEEGNMASDPDIAAIGILSLTIGFIGLKDGTNYLSGYKYKNKTRKVNEAFVDSIVSKLF
jgi:TetR/AcrR family transcriptional regulator